MRPHLTSKSCYSLALVFVFFLCFQTLSQAQLTIHNNTSCTVYIQASQVDNGSGQPCTRCNVSAVTAVPAGGTWVHPGDATCGHFRWLGVRWYTHPTGAVGISYNPIWAGACGTNSPGGRCNGAGTFARWNVPSSPGPASVTIHGN